MAFINDIADGFDDLVLYLIYADDLQVYIRFPLEKLQLYNASMSYHGDLVIQWADPNQLLLNVAKTKSIVIGSYYYIDRLLANLIKGVILNGTLIKFEKSVKTLGVVPDDELNWMEHFTAISKKSNSLMYQLNFFRKSTSFGLRKHLIVLLIFPLVDY